MEPSTDWWFESKKYWSLGIVAETKKSHHPCDHQSMMCLVKQMYVITQIIRTCLVSGVSGIELLQLK